MRLGTKRDALAGERAETARRSERSAPRIVGRAISPAVATMALAFLQCTHSTCASQPTAKHEAAGAPSAAVRAAGPLEIAELVYDDGLKNQWQDWGWAPREVPRDGPAKVRFSDYGGWILAKPGLSGSYDAVRFRVKRPAGEGEFLEVGVELGGTKRPHIHVTAGDAKDLGDGWTEVVLPMDRLNPGSAPFDHVVFQAYRTVPGDWVLLNGIALMRRVSKPSTAYTPQEARPVAARVACDAQAIPVSPLIYGAAGDIDATIHRWGGNPTTTYNWEAKVWNVGKDWFFENHSAPDYRQFLSENASHHTLSALTVPILGWVAKDGSSNGFPVSVYGPQAETDPWRPDAGNGRTRAGAPISPILPPAAGQPAPPSWIKRWVSEIASADAKSGKRSVAEYILDNEPMLWHETHRSMRPDPLGYDELLHRTIDYGSAIREADPTAVIAGPAEWGWTGYFYSAKDIAQGGPSARIDRRLHGDVPLVEWYLRKLRDQEQTSGVRILDVFDLHYYPQADKVYSDASDPATSALRLRSTRSLWDKTYVDESWIKDTIALLPRMREWVDRNYPGRAISIGEWNFGGEGHISGALAIAETLGRFAQFGVTSAFYWMAPPRGSPGAQGFVAYRNFDGKGGRFLDWYVPTTSASRDVSLFASRDDGGTHGVVVVVNLSSEDAILVKIDTASCGTVVSRQAYSFSAGASQFQATAMPPTNDATVNQVLAPWSIAVIDLRFGPPIRGQPQPPASAAASTGP